jgi:hypothetical protein
MADETIYRVAAELRETAKGGLQRLTLAPLVTGDDK